MSLDYRTANVKDKANVYDKEGNLTGLAQTIIFACMFVEIGEITEENAEEFFKRISIYELAFDALRQKNGEPIFVTLKEVKAMIGLKTNIADKSFAQFKRGVGDAMMRRLLEKWERAKASTIVKEEVFGSGPKEA